MRSAASRSRDSSASVRGCCSGQTRRRPRFAQSGAARAVPARRVGARPVGPRTQRDDRFDHVELRRIGGRLRAPRLPVHRRDLGEPHDDAVLRRQRPPRLFDRDARERRRHDEERALVERRHELRAEPLKRRHRRDHEQRPRRRPRGSGSGTTSDRDRPVDRAEQPADGIGRLGAEASLQQEHHQRRCERDREHRGGEHRERLRVGERHEQAPGLAGQA